MPEAQRSGWRRYRRLCWWKKCSPTASPEILIRHHRRPAVGQVLVLGAGGVFTEILSDSVSLLPPWTRGSIESALHRLCIAKLFGGYRGKPAADVDALIGTILGVARYASANLSVLVELDVNPVIVRPAGLGAVAVDTMIRLRGPLKE